MPVRRRQNRRANRAGFVVTPEMVKAFRAYIDTDEPQGQQWSEHWTLHDLLADAGALELPFIPPCCWHPRLAIQWQHRPDALAIYNRLQAET